MIWFYAYLGLGLVVLLSMLTFHFKQAGFRVNARRLIMEAIDPNQRRWFERFMRYLVVPVLTAVVVVLIWPVALVIHAKEVRQDWRDTYHARERDFAVRLEDLLRPVLLEAVEADELVHDPLQAVPDLPFGHLHAAWRRFIVTLDLDDELWQFRAVRQPWDDQQEVSTGYVLVRQHRPGAFFRASRRIVEVRSPSAAPHGAG
jgi:hypothetical protein